MMLLGIRREDKNRWEGRVPLTPDDVRKLANNGIRIRLQPSKIRIFPDSEYLKAGAEIDEDLSPCPIILGVKEMPPDFFRPGKTYLFFSHTIKGQKQNMPMLARMMETGCNLIDYELVTDDEGRRLIFFGKHAGLAGMIDTLWAFGKRLAWEGKANPFEDIKMAHEYGSLEDAKSHISEIAAKIESRGVPSEIAPVICSFAGYGHVSGGAQEIFDLLPHEVIDPADLLSRAPSLSKVKNKLFKVVFKEEDIVEPIEPDRKFELQDYYRNPSKYRSIFERYLPHLSILVNCIYWDERYPRLVTVDYLKRSFSAGNTPSLRVIGDISCDIEGSIQCTVKATDPGNPVYVYHPSDATFTDGWKGTGPVMMAVDNLPCELSREASEFFGQELIPFIPQLAEADFDVPFEKLDLPPQLERAVILHKGKLTPRYEHLARYL